MSAVPINNGRTGGAQNQRFVGRGVHNPQTMGQDGTHTLIFLDVFHFCRDPSSKCWKLQVFTTHFQVVILQDDG